MHVLGTHSVGRIVSTAVMQISSNHTAQDKSRTTMNATDWPKAP